MAVKKNGKGGAAASATQKLIELAFGASFTYLGVRYEKGKAVPVDEDLFDELMELTDARTDLPRFKEYRPKKAKKAMLVEVEDAEDGEGTEEIEGEQQEPAGNPGRGVIV